MAKVSSIQIFLSLATIFSWPIYQLDVNDAFLNGDMTEEIFMEQPPRFVAQGKNM